jgi:hypothetical protein
MAQGTPYADTSLRRGPDSKTSGYHRRRSGSIAVEGLSIILRNHAKDFSVHMTETMGSNLAESLSVEDYSGL